MSTESRLGEPIELPWWALLLSLPPAAVVVAALLIPGSLGGRALAVLPSVALIAAVLRVARRVTSTSMQSVWVSAAYGVWAIFPTAWIVLLATS